MNSSYSSGAKLLEEKFNYHELARNNFLKALRIRVSRSKEEIEENIIKEELKNCVMNLERAVKEGVITPREELLKSETVPDLDNKQVNSLIIYLSQTYFTKERFYQK